VRRILQHQGGSNNKRGRQLPSEERTALKVIQKSSAEFQVPGCLQGGEQGRDGTDHRPLGDFPVLAQGSGPVTNAEARGNCYATREAAAKTDRGVTLSPCSPRCYCSNNPK
jgi:hypothetical protein